MRDFENDDDISTTISFRIPLNLYRMLGREMVKRQITMTELLKNIIMKYYKEGK